MKGLIVIAFLIIQVIEPRWHVVGASIEPGVYYVYHKSEGIPNDGFSDIGLRQPPTPPTIEGCTIIAYSDYWTEDRGISVSDGYALFRVRESDYAISNDCVLIKKKPHRLYAYRD